MTATAQQRLTFVVVSFNRGQFLRHCVESIERCAPRCRIVIADDGSTDPQTREILACLAERHCVTGLSGQGGHKHGGLYGLMQHMFERVAGDELLCFLQDDTQLVRELTVADQEFIATRFRADPQLGFMSPAFIPSSRARSGRYRHDAELGLFFPLDTDRSAGIHYSDLHITSVERLRSVGWAFLQGERANQRQARAHFCELGYLPRPFVMWLPYSTAYRGKRKTWAMQYAERSRGCGFHPLSYMTAQDVETLAAQVPPALPVAERYLRTRDGQLRQPWIYTPLQGSRLLKHLDRGERLLRSLLRRPPPARA